MVLGLAKHAPVSLALRAGAGDYPVLVRIIGPSGKHTAGLRTLRLVIGGSVLSLTALAAAAAAPQAALCDSSGSNIWRSLVPSASKASDGGAKRSSSSSHNHDDNADDAVTALIDKLDKNFGQLGFGGVLGVCSGYSMKKIGKFAAFVIGTGFIAIQTAQHLGYVNVSWTDLQKRASNALDTNSDGEFDKEDLKVLWRKFRTVLKKNLPGGAAFGTGFAVGFYFG